MSSLRFVVVSLALLAIIGFVACQFEGMGGRKISPEKRKKLQEVMKKSCEKADIKEEQLLKMKACDGGGIYLSLLRECNDKVLGKTDNLVDKWKKQCSVKKQETAKKLQECFTEGMKKFREMSADDRKAVSQKMLDERIACMEKALA